MEHDILSVGFDGCHRVGKGTQIDFLKSELKERQIPFIVARGDGSRPNQGNSLGDPYSDWWADFLPQLRSENSKIEDWDVSGCKLAKEIIQIRDSVLPQLCSESSSKLGVLILDRSILSRAAVVNELAYDYGEDLYPKDLVLSGYPVTAESVCPDVLFNLVADKPVLLSRLSLDDPKYEFRKNNIENTADFYYRAESLIPESLREKVVSVDASQTPEAIRGQVRQHIIKLLGRKCLLDLLE